jgi:hypothetical protein
MSGRPAVQRSVVLGLAVGGVLLGHAITYGLLVPDVHARAATLAQTGHGYLEVLVRLGLGGVLVALGAAFLGRLLRVTGPVSAFAPLAGRLAGFQLGAFAVMEVGERVAAGASLHDLPSVLGVGFAIQTFVALIGAGVLHVTFRVADGMAATFGAARPRLPRAALAIPAPAAPIRPHPTHPLLPDRRGPPQG